MFSLDGPPIPCRASSIPGIKPQSRVGGGGGELQTAENYLRHKAAIVARQTEEKHFNLS